MRDQRSQALGGGSAAAGGYYRVGGRSRRLLGINGVQADGSAELAPDGMSTASVALEPS